MSDSTLSENPFASPLSAGNASLHDPREMYVVGRDLVVRSKVILPRRCVRTNVETPSDCERRKTLYWASPWIAVLILINLLILLLVYVLVRKKCEVTYSEARHLIQRRKQRVLIMSLLVFGSVIAFCYGMMVEQWALIGASALVFLVSLIGLVFVAQPPLRIVKHNDGQFWIRGCSDAFLRDLTEGTS